jgi:hypothetical protein
MKKEEIQQMINFLNENLNESEKMFNAREESHAYIVGYLQGTIKAVRGHLNNNLKN